jgi:hypothetical protein
MRVQQPGKGTRRTLYGQKTLPGADHLQALTGGGQALSAGAKVPEVASKLSISEATFHCWKNLYSGQKADLQISERGGL